MLGEMGRFLARSVGNTARNLTLPSSLRIASHPHAHTAITASFCHLLS